MLMLVACALGGYLVGSIPFGILLSRAAGAPDPRTIGSGNIGATNVLRSGRRWLALATLLGDAGKGLASALIAGALVSPAGAAVAGGAAFVGHLYPVWLKFRGGKGVATFYGVLFGVAWPVALIAGAAWLLTAFLFRFSSLAALVAALVAPVAMLVLGEGLSRVMVAAIMGALIFLRHRSNIARLLRREEPRIGAQPA